MYRPGKRCLVTKYHFCCPALRMNGGPLLLPGQRITSVSLDYHISTQWSPITRHNAHYGHYAVPCWSRSDTRTAVNIFLQTLETSPSYGSRYRHVHLCILKRNLQTCCENCAFDDGMSHHQTLFIMSASMLHMLE